MAAVQGVRLQLTTQPAVAHDPWYPCPRPSLPRCPQPAPDPRLDPSITPKRAQRILANRLAAAKSKLRKQAREQVRSTVYFIDFCGASVVAGWTVQAALQGLACLAWGAGLLCAAACRAGHAASGAWEQLTLPCSAAEPLMPDTPPHPLLLHPPCRAWPRGWSC